MKRDSPFISSELAHSIIRHKRLYYAGKPEITDDVYDILEERLRTLDPNHPALELVGSDGVSSSEKGETQKAEHLFAMLSLNKTYVVEDIAEWAKAESVFATLKLDGNSLALIYTQNDVNASVQSQGQLRSARTRGNGRFGEEVTETARWARGIFSTITGHAWQELALTSPKAVNRLEIRGELCCSFQNFLAIADEMQCLGLARPTHPRNIVAGVLGRKSHIDLARYFDFLPFEVLGADGYSAFSSEVEKFNWLHKAGFRVPLGENHESSDSIGVSNDTISGTTNTSASGFIEKATAYMKIASECLLAIQELDEEVPKVLPEASASPLTSWSDGIYPIDGVVFSLSNTESHRELGMTSHHPRYKLSYKWKGETAEAKIVRIDWATSRLGNVTPVAVIEPTFLSGATIQNVTLHNAAHVRQHQLKAGDSIEIIRSGEVIPKFLSVLSSVKGKAHLPHVCPACQHVLYDDETRLICTNQSCPAQRLGRIINWIRAAEIEDLSDKRVQAMLDAGLVQSPEDLYALSLEDMLMLPLTKEKMATKLLAAIEASKDLPLPNFLSGLGISGGGRTTWSRVIAVYPSLTQIRNLSAEALAELDGFAETSAEALVLGLEDKSDRIDALLTAGVKPRQVSPSSKGGALEELTLVITGKLQNPRESYKRKLHALGATLSSAVSGKTSALVMADPDSKSSKAKKARALAITILAESDLIRLLEAPELRTQFFP